MAGVRHLEFSKFALNFQVDWFSILVVVLIYSDFYVSAFWLEIAYFGPKFDTLVANRGQLLK